MFLILFGFRGASARSIFKCHAYETDKPKDLKHSKLWDIFQNEPTAVWAEAEVNNPIMSFAKLELFKVLLGKNLIFFNFVEEEQQQ